MEMVGTIGSGVNTTGTIYKTKANNYIDAPSVDGRKTQIQENSDGSYNVTVTKDGDVQYNERLSESELVNNFGADISSLDITKPLGTNSQADAQAKYGDNVAKNFYAVA